MNETINLLKGGFVSSSGLTPEFAIFFKTFKREFKRELETIDAGNIVINRGHFHISGFFTLPSGTIYYFSMPDVRGFKFNSGHFGSLFYRTAKSYSDYTGECNNYVLFTEDMVNNMRLN